MTAVVDTSPLLALSRLSLLDLLPELFGEVLLPEAVRAEAVEGRPRAPDVEAIRVALEAGRLRVRAVGERDPEQAAPDNLGRGEQEAIALGLLVRADVVVIDDRVARRAARDAGLRVIGVVGVLVAARRAGLIPAVAPLVEQLRAQGFRLSDDVVEAIERDEAQLD